MLSWTRMEVASCGFPSTFHCLVFTSHVPKTDALPTALHSGFFTLINNLTAIYLANQRISNKFCRLLHAKQSLKGCAKQFGRVPIRSRTNLVMRFSCAVLPSCVQSSHSEATALVLRDLSQATRKCKGRDCLCKLLFYAQNSSLHNLSQQLRFWLIVTPLFSKKQHTCSAYCLALATHKLSQHSKYHHLLCTCGQRESNPYPLLGRQTICH